MTKISYFGKQNSTLGSVVPLVMFIIMFKALKFFQREFNSSLKKGYTVTTNWWTHAINQM